LGTHGRLHKIKEAHFKEFILKQKPSVTKKELIDIAKESKKNALKIKGTLPVCKTNKQRVYIPTYKIEKDIKMPYSEDLLKKAGEYNILEDSKIFISKYLFIVNTDIPEQILLVDTYLEKSQSRMEVYVENGDMKKLIEKGLDSPLKANKEMLKSFGIQCTPSIVTQQGNKLMISEYSLAEEK